MTSDGVTWSRDAASKSWECSSGGIRAPTMGETIVTLAVENSVQILPRPCGGIHSCRRRLDGSPNNKAGPPPPFGPPEALQ